MTTHKKFSTYALSALTVALIASGVMFSIAPVWAAGTAPEAVASAKSNGETAIQSVRTTESAGVTALRIKLSKPIASLPTINRISNPERLMFDLPDTINGTGARVHQVSTNNIKDVNVVQAQGVTRIVANLREATAYRIANEGDEIVVFLGEKKPIDAPRQFSQGDATKSHALTAIDFRRGPAGEGRIVFDLDDNTTGIEIKQQGAKLLVDFKDATVAEKFVRRWNVADYGTPVGAFDIQRVGTGARMTLEPSGLWEYNSYQADNRFVVEVRPVAFDPNKLVQGTNGSYKGERLSLNFQNIDVRNLLNIIADFTKINIVAADNVQGMMTLRLQDVPWDQALSIILQTRNLDMRKNGNVIWVAPRDEIAKTEREKLEVSNQTNDLETLRSESFVLNYTRAEDVVKLLSNDRQRVLSKRGSVVVDTRTNQVFIQDIGSKLDDVRLIIAKVDVPVRQVQIEARIVEANDKFSRSLGARLGFASMAGRSINAGNGSGLNFGSTTAVGDRLVLPGLNSVNLPATALDGTAPATLATALFNSAGTRLLSLELSALEEDGRGKIVSSPSVVTADQEKAIIEQGTELPYLEASASGAATVSFKKANLKLEVTPQITPDGNVIMMVDINKDAPGVQTVSGFAIDTKHVKTKVLVDNGGTVVIGGIFSQDERNTVNKVPFLGDLPIIGNVFKNTVRSDTKTELLVFLTPRILDTRVNNGQK